MYLYTCHISIGIYHYTTKVLILIASVNPPGCLRGKSCSDRQYVNPDKGRPNDPKVVGSLFLVVELALYQLIYNPGQQKSELCVVHCVKVSVTREESIPNSSNPPGKVLMVLIKVS